jgi:hypothetical protein
VQRAEQTLERVLQHEARRDTDVARNAFGERMVALVEAAAVERESERLHDVDAEVPLAAHEKRPSIGSAGDTACNSIASVTSPGRRCVRG